MVDLLKPAGDGDGGTNNHNLLTNLAWPNDDHQQYVLRFPGAGARNIIQPTADITPLTIQGAIGQTTNLTEWQDSTTAVLAQIDSVGNLGIRNNNELRFYDNGNYVGFEAPVLTGNQIWVLPDADGNNGDVMVTDGAGILTWSPCCTGGDIWVDGGDFIYPSDAGDYSVGGSGYRLTDDGDVLMNGYQLINTDQEIQTCFTINNSATGNLISCQDSSVEVFNMTNTGITNFYADAHFEDDVYLNGTNVYVRAEPANHGALLFVETGKKVNEDGNFLYWTAANLLNVGGELEVTGTAGFGTAPVAVAGIDVDFNYSGNLNAYGQRILFDASAPVISTPNAYGLYVEAEATGLITTELAGGYFEGYLNSADNFGTLSGVKAFAGTKVGAGGTITDAMSVYALAPSVGGGAITNAYAGYFGRPTTGANNWSIYAEGLVEIGRNLIVNGDTDLGDLATDDTLTCLARIDSDLVPFGTSTYNLGATGQFWNHTYTDYVNLNNTSYLDGTGGNFIYAVTNNNTRKTMEMVCSTLANLGAVGVNFPVLAGGDADVLSWSGIGAGVAHTGSTLGYWDLDSALDYVVIGFSFPELFVRDGNQGSFTIEFDCERGGANDATVSINLYEAGAVGSIFADTFTALAARGYRDLDGSPGGIGNDANLIQGRAYVMKIEVAEDPVHIYRIRFKYTVGIDNDLA